MKRIILFILAAIPLLVNSQNFNKGAISIHNNYGIDIYDTKYTYHVKYNNLDTTIVSTDKAACMNIVLGGDYCVIDRLAIGARIKVNKYFTSQDSVTKTTPLARSQDFTAMLNYHLVDKEVFDFSAGINVGISHLYYNDNLKTSSSNGTIVRGIGPYIQFQISPQFFIKQRVGLGISIYSPIVNYSKMKTSNNDINQYAIAKWKGSGYGFSFNINVKIK